MAILPLASLERAMPIISCLFMYAAYPACSLWLFLPIHCMRLILPAHYGDSMPMMASPKGAMPPLFSSLAKRVLDTQRFFLRVAMVPSAYYYISIPALLIWVTTVPGAYPYQAYLPTRYQAYLSTQRFPISSVCSNAIFSVYSNAALSYIQRIFQRDI